ISPVIEVRSLGATFSGWGRSALQPLAKWGEKKTIDATPKQSAPNSARRARRTGRSSTALDRSSVRAHAERARRWARAKLDEKSPPSRNAFSSSAPPSKLSDNAGTRCPSQRAVRPGSPTFRRTPQRAIAHQTSRGVVQVANAKNRPIQTAPGAGKAATARL